MPTGPRPLTPNVAEVTMGFREDGQYLFNTHHFFDDVGWDEGRLNNLGSAVLAWWNSNLKNYVSSAVQLATITCRDLSSASGFETAVTTGLPVTGSAGSFPLPNSVTISVSKRTGRAGRAYRGRTYHIGLTEEQVNGNTMETATLGHLLDAYTALIHVGSGVFNPDLCVLSETLGGAWRGTGIATNVTGISIDTTIDNQRRRLPGRGR